MRWPARFLVGALVLVAAACGRPGARLTPAERTLAARAGIPDSVVLALRRYGTELRRLEGIDTLGEKAPVAGISAALSEGRARQAVDELGKRLPAGFVVLRTEQGFGRAPDRIAVVRARDPYDVLRLLGTNGWNYGIGPWAVADWLKTWDGRVGLTVIGAGFDWTEARITRPPADMLPFARAVYQFCPDVVDQGTGSVEELAKEMKKSGTVYLWWD